MPQQPSLMSRRLEKCPSDQLMMTIEKAERSTSPVHVHVDETTPVHVHVKKPKKSALSKHEPAARTMSTTDQKTKPLSSTLYSDSNLRRSTATDSHPRRSTATDGHSRRPTATARSKSPGPRARSPTHWVPPPGRSSKGNNSKLSWQGPSHRLEIGAQDPDTLHMSDLNTDDEDAVNNKMRVYERKIDSLMTEVGTLKNEVTLQRTYREMDKREELLSSSRRVLEDQDHELRAARDELIATESENRALRKDVESLRLESDLNRSLTEHTETEKDLLMNKLVEVEMDGQAAAKQVAALRDVIRRLREDKHIPSSEASLLTKQRELLMERLSDFERTNRTLRRMLRERHDEHGSASRMAEQRDILLRKLTETEDELQSYRTQLIEKDRVLCDLRMQNDSQRDETLALGSLQASLETTRAHLQKQLRQKEGDCNRMAVQIRSLESQLAQEKIDVDHLRQLLGDAKEKAERDKEALKKATRVQKQRASKSEDAVDSLNAQLMERDGGLAELRAELDGLRARCDKLGREKTQAAGESQALKVRLAELESVLEHLEEDSKVKVEGVTQQLQDRAAENAKLRMENERIKTSQSMQEDKIVQSEAETAQLKASLRQYETLVDEYRSQSGKTATVEQNSENNKEMNRSRREADETIVQLEDQKRETSRARQDGESELDKVKVRLQTRLQELEPIPEMLRTTETRLADANGRLLEYEQRNTEHTRLVTELTAKVDLLTGNLDDARDKYHSCRDEGRSFQAKLDSLDRKLLDVESQNKELLTTIAKREDSVHQVNLRLEDKSRECSSLALQLDAALTESRRLTEDNRDKTLSKDRSTAARILDLEAQLSQTRAEVARVRREKEETERKFNSRLYDLKDRLDQSHSTNRSMQNYVHFLKNSYANVFGDSALGTPSGLGAPSVGPGSSPHRPLYH